MSVARLGRALDRLYDAAGVLAALAIALICALICAQIALNAAARLGGAAWSRTIPSYAELAGFLLAAASFLALAHTLRRGAHIRVTLVVGRLPPGPRRALDAAALLLAAAASAYATLFAGRLVAASWRFGDTSPGLLAVPLWIPQAPLCLGLALLTTALLHTLAEVIATGREIPGDGSGGE